MNLIAFRIRTFLTTVLLAVLIIGGETQQGLAKWSDGKIPIFAPGEFSINSKFHGIYYIFDFKTENNGNMVQMIESECDVTKCKFRFYYNGKKSDLFIIDSEYNDTYWDFHIGFFEFSNISGAYKRDDQIQFLLLRMYINAKMSKDFGFGYIGIASCKELDVCRHIEDVARKNSINYDLYGKIMNDLSRFKAGNESIFERINKAFYFLSSLSDKHRDDEGQ